MSEKIPWVATFTHRYRDSWAGKVIWAEDRAEAMEEARRLAGENWNVSTLRRMYA